MQDDLACSFCSAVDDVGARRGELPVPAGGACGGLLSVIVLFDHPFSFEDLDEALFSLAAQDRDEIEVILVLPDCGPAVHREAEDAIRAQSWPDGALAKVVSVSIPSSRGLSAGLIGVGLAHATGRYVAFLHHQDLIYQHTYQALIERLEASDAVTAFGGVRLADHARGPAHWLVETKRPAPASVSRLGRITDGSAAIHCFVADRGRLPEDYLRVHSPSSELAVTMFLLRLSLHPGSDFSLASTPVCESRHFSDAPSGGGGRLPSAVLIASSIEAEGPVLRDSAISPGSLLLEAIKAIAHS